MDRLRRAALVLVVLLPVMMIIGCGGDDDDDGNGLIAFQSGAPTPGVFIMDGDGNSEQLVIADAREPALNPRAQTVAFARGADIFLVNLNGTGLTNLTNNGLGVNASSPAFDRQGTQIAYVLTPTVPNGVSSSIRLMDANGDNDVELVADGDEPTFSPNGAQIVFVRQPDLFLINTDGTGLTQLTSNEAGDTVNDPSFSPFGDRVVFEYVGVVATPDIRFIDLGDLMETQLVDNARQPTFSPFGNRVAFVRGGAIFSVDVDGTDLRQLTAGPNDAEPDWSVSP